MAADLAPLMRSMRPLESAREIRAGSDDPIIRMKGCPDCGGLGWRCTTPFATVNVRYVQCPTCEDAKRHVDEHGTLPADIAEAMSTCGVRASLPCCPPGEPHAFDCPAGVGGKS